MDFFKPRKHVAFRRYFLIPVLYTLLAVPAYAGSDKTGNFIENKGQWPSQVLFAADIPGGTLYVERSRLIYSFYLPQHQHDDPSVKHTAENDTTPNAHAFELKFVHGYTGLRAAGYNPAATTFNYWNGNDPSKWISHARAFEGVELQDIYPGIHLKLYRQGASLKYDFIVTPQGRIEDILLEYNGLDGIRLADGNLNLQTALGELTEMKPYAFQVHGTQQHEVKCTFKLHNNRVTFDAPASWDRTNSLIIDPLIVFSAYSGSTADNWGNTATYDDEGNLYSAGIVSSAGYPVKTGAYQTSFGGGSWDIGIMKFDSAGTRLIYATYLGGRSSETPQSLVVNHAGELLILGTTSSTNFPVTNGSTFSGGNNFTPMDGVPYSNGSDLFVAKLSADGTRLLASTYFGGSNNDGVNFVSGQFNTNGMVQSPLCKNYGDQFRGDIITDSDDNVYIASNTTSTNLPGRINTFAGGTHDAIVVRFQPDLSDVVWSRYLGGSATDAAYSLKLDSLSNLFIAGGTTSTNFDGINGFKKTKGSDIDGWIAHVSADGQSIINATYLGTNAYDQVYFLDLNSAGEVYLFGQTQGFYPVTPGIFSQSGGGQFIHKLSYDLQRSIFSTVFGSGGNSPNISPTAFLVNDCNKIYLAGWGGALNTTTISYRTPQGPVTITRNFVGGDTRGLRVSSDAYQSATTGNDFYLMVLDEDASAFLYGTFLGGSNSATHVDGGTSRFDKRGIVYHAVCAGCGGYSDFPAVNSPAGHSQNAARNGAGCNNAAFKFDLATLRAALQSNSTSFNTPGIDTLCYPSAILFQNLSGGAKYYVWDLGDSTVITKNDTSHITHTYQKPGIYLVTLTAYNNETCEGLDEASMLISVFDPEVEVADDGTICEGSSYQLFASGGKRYSWTSDDGSFASSLPNPAVTPQDTTAYYVIIADEVGCDIQDTVIVDVIPKAQYELQITKDYDCWNRPEIRFAYATEDDYTYSWDLGDGTVSTSKDFVHHYSEDGTFTVIFQAINDYCAYQESTSVPVITVRIPNVITPGHDGLNDVLRVEAADAINVQIYNRWGELVFREENYNNDWYAKGLASGTYFYKIDVKDQTTCRGWIQVVK
jgi:gliding motility-associated-like protein